MIFLEVKLIKSGEQFNKKISYVLLHTVLNQKLNSIHIATINVKLDFNINCLLLPSPIFLTHSGSAQQNRH